MRKRLVASDTPDPTYYSAHVDAMDNWLYYFAMFSLVFAVVLGSGIVIYYTMITAIRAYARWQRRRTELKRQFTKACGLPTDDDPWWHHV